MYKTLVSFQPPPPPLSPQTKHSGIFVNRNYFGDESTQEPIILATSKIYNN